MSSPKQPRKSESSPVDSESESLDLTVWGAMKARLAKRNPKPDYGTGYYVRSTAHPVVSGPGSDMSLEEIYGALNTLDEAYVVDETQRN